MLNKKNNDYSRGFNWGRKTIKEKYHEYGDRGIYSCDKAAMTCKKYAEDKKVSKNSKGKQLTKKMRDYYRGISDGMQRGYNDLFK